MKSINEYIQEKLIIKNDKTINYKYFPETNGELKDIIKKRIKEEGNEVDLNDINVSNITDMSNLFYGLDHFNGDISNWDVSNVNDMRSMFYWCSAFDKDISNWDVSNVKYIGYMFYKCESFNQDISNWDVSNIKDFNNIFSYCKIEEKYKPKFI